MQLTYTKIRENIWQIAEDKGVFCTLVKGHRISNISRYRIWSI